VPLSSAAHGIAADLGTESGANTGIARFKVNVLSGVRLSWHYIDPMKEANWGRIIFISSVSALQIPAEMIHYGTTKTAQIAVSRGLAETTTGTAVTVNTVLAGPTKSEGVLDFVDRLAAERGIERRAFEREFFEHARYRADCGPMGG